MSLGKLDDKFWESYFQVYDVLNRVIPYQEMMKEVLQHVDLFKGCKILDAGCGSGNFSMSISSAELTGLDREKTALKIYTKKNPLSNIIQHDITKPLPLNSDYFDNIVCINTLYTILLEKRSMVLEEFYRVLKKGGTLTLVNPLINSSVINIYMYQLKELKQKNGLLIMLKQVIQFMIPTIKMFYYNYIISKQTKKGNYNFFSIAEQERMLVDANFKIAKSKLTYAKQAVLTVVYK